MNTCEGYEKDTKMSKSTNSKEKPRCAICGNIVTKRVNKSGRPYWVLHKIKPDVPIVCDVCANYMVEIAEEMEEKLFAKEDNAEIEAIKTMQSMANSGKNDKEENASEEKELSLNEIISKVKENIKGQDEQVEQIATALFLNSVEQNVKSKRNLIVLGPTGSGKTETLKSVMKCLNMGYVIEDATRYSKVGYVGENVDSMLYNLYIACGKDLSRTEKGVVILDEVDKKMEKTVGDVSGEDVLFSMLKMVEGTKISIEVEKSAGSSITLVIDTSNITFVAIGAFPQLEQVRKNRLLNSGAKKAVIGFNSNLGSSNDAKEEAKGYIADDFSKAGFPKEFVARFSSIVEMNALSKETLQSIVVNSESSQFKIFVDALTDIGVIVEYNQTLIEAIVDKAYSLNSGARSIKNIVGSFETNIKRAIYTSEDEIAKCIINDDIVSNPNSFTLVSHPKS